MRDFGDYDASREFKRRTVFELRAYGFDLRLAFEDDRRNYDMFHARGRSPASTSTPATTSSPRGPGPVTEARPAMLASCAWRGLCASAPPGPLHSDQPA